MTTQDSQGSNDARLDDPWTPEMIEKLNATPLTRLRPPKVGDLVFWQDRWWVIGMWLRHTERMFVMPQRATEDDDDMTELRWPEIKRLKWTRFAWEVLSDGTV